MPLEAYLHARDFFVPDIPYPILVILIFVAILVGLWVGSRARESVDTYRKRDGGASFATRARQVATRGLVALWQWNRGQKQDDSSRSKDD